MKKEELLVQELIKRKEKITTAESCTGGLVAGQIINVPGASSVFDEGYITYANSAKTKLVGVSKNILETVGAVSEECAIAMAKGCLNAANADMGLSTTGIAGPDGGTIEKPVGMVYICCCYGEKIAAKKCMFDGNREEIRIQTVDAIIELALKMLT